MRNEKDDLVIDTLHDIREVIESAIDGICADENVGKKREGYIIDQAEDELRELLYKTQDIYSNMIAKRLEQLETKELIQRKKPSLPKEE